MAIHVTQTAAYGLPLLPADLDISYSPDALLEVPFRASVASQADFAVACAEGFESYFHGLIDEDENGEEVFVKRGYTWDEVVAFLVECIADFQEPMPFSRMSLAWVAGFSHGWLSALALFQAEDVWRAVVVMLALLGPGAVSSGKRGDQGADQVVAYEVSPEMTKDVPLDSMGWPLDI